MSFPTAWIWIILPLFWSLLLLLVAYFRRVQMGLALAGSLVLAWVAWTIPVDQVFTIREFSFKLVDTFDFLGREFVLGNEHEPLLLGLYLIVFLWLLAAFFVQPGGRFAPMVFAIIALLTAALAVRPFLYAALLFEIAVLLSIPLLIEPGKGAGPGILRFLGFQTLGMPFILFAGWMLAGVESGPGNLDLVVRAGVMLGIGLVFLLGIFPFHSWIPLLFEETRPFVVSFVVVMLLGLVSVFGITFLDRFVWLRDSEMVYALLRGIGTVMVLAGGIWAAFEGHLARMLGDALVLETGMYLLAIGLGNVVGVTLFFALTLPRIVSVIMWAASLEVFSVRSNGDLSLESWRGKGNEVPLATFTLMLALFSLAGLPGLAGFPTRLALWQNLAASHPFAAIGAVLGTLGLMVGGLRVLYSLMLLPETETAAETEQAPTGQVELPQLSPEAVMNRLILWIFLGFSALLSMFVGLFPHWFLPALTRMLVLFNQLGS